MIKSTLIEDTRQQVGKHRQKELYFQQSGIELLRCCLPYGDYMLIDGSTALSQSCRDLSELYLAGSDIQSDLRKTITDALRALHGRSVDTKRNMQEVYGNVVTDRARFCRECELGGKDLYILVEDKSIDSIEDVSKWKNPRIEQYYKRKALGYKVPKRPPASSNALMKMMQKISDAYGTHWIFCEPKDAGSTILRILTGG